MSAVQTLACQPTDWLRPSWTHGGVNSVMTTRHGGSSAPPFDCLNLKYGLGDADSAVASNQAALRTCIGAQPVWLDQVHGCRVVQLQPEDALPGAAVHRADASICSVPGIACMVQVADCLPVLMSAAGRAVAAAHAGWRGLAAGVLDATVAALCEAADCSPDEIEAWLGACIGPRQFEVGADVLDAFRVDPFTPALASTRFVSRGGDHPDKWLADLSGLAEDRLGALGVSRVRAVRLCTVEDGSRFFSYRRDRITGRMAAGIWFS